MSAGAGSTAAGTSGARVGTAAAGDEPTGTVEGLLSWVGGPSGPAGDGSHFTGGGFGSGVAGALVSTAWGRAGTRKSPPGRGGGAADDGLTRRGALPSMNSSLRTDSNSGMPWRRVTA